MPIQLDKILNDILKEKVLKPGSPVSKDEIDAAWIRVGKRSNLSVHEVRSIFKVLQKKYEQEKMKDRSAWKLFPMLDEIHQLPKPESPEEEQLPMEEDEEYEMLEVQEDEDQQQAVSSENIGGGNAHSSGGETSDTESPSKSIKSEKSSHCASPERFDKQSSSSVTTSSGASSTSTNSTILNTGALTASDEKKVLNSLVSISSRMNNSAAAALQKKGITVKKTIMNGPTNNKATVSKQQNKQVLNSGGNALLAIGKTIQLPESLKRKLSEDQQQITPSKKQLLPTKKQSPNKSAGVSAAADESEKQTITVVTNGGNNSNGTAHTAHHGINLITIPANDTSCGSLIVNGSGHATLSDATSSVSSPRIEDVDFKNDIIFDTSIPPGGVDSITITENGKKLPKISNSNGTGNDEKQFELELGNSDSILPRTFFKNLCSSTRYESFGLYVANSMNRLDQRTASRLETKILGAIIDAQNESLVGDS